MGVEGRSAVAVVLAGEVGTVLGFVLPPSACRTDKKNREVHSVLLKVLCFRHQAVVV